MRRVAATICEPLLTSAALEGIRRAIATRYPDAAIVRRHERRAYIVVETDPHVTRAERREIRRRYEGGAPKAVRPRRRSPGRPPRARAPAAKPREIMKYRLQVVGLATGKPHPSDGQFVKDADVDARNGLGELVTTTDPSEAMFFPSADAAWMFWQRRSSVRGLRADGLPNRPLTAFHMVIEPVE